MCCVVELVRETRQINKFIKKITDTPVLFSSLFGRAYELIISFHLQFHSFGYKVVNIGRKLRTRCKLYIVI